MFLQAHLHLFYPINLLALDFLEPDSRSRTSSFGITISCTTQWRAHFVLDTETREPAVLVVSDTFDPGSRAWDNGRPVLIARGNHALRVVFLPPAVTRSSSAFGSRAYSSASESRSPRSG
jgi:hypothetical protein